MKQYTYGLYIGGLCVDEIVINFEDIVVATAEFMEILGWEQRRGGQDYEIHLMTDNTDEVDIEKFFDEGLCPACDGIDYQHVTDLSQMIGHDWKNITIDFACDCGYNWSLRYGVKDYV